MLSMRTKPIIEYIQNKNIANAHVQYIQNENFLVAHTHILYRGGTGGAGFTWRVASKTRPCETPTRPKNLGGTK